MVNLIISLREWRHNSSTSISPSELVFLCKDLRASVSSDIVYGVSGLFESEGSYGSGSPFSINYNQSTAEVYKRFTIWSIQQENTLDILAQQRYENGRPLSPMLPTWATDWTMNKLSEFNVTEITSLTSQLRQKTPNMLGSSPVYRRYSNALMIRGYVFDTFSGAFPIKKDNFPYSPGEFHGWLRLISDNREANKLLFGHENPTTETLELLCKRTVERDAFLPHFRCDGPLLTEPRTTNFRLPILTKRGCLALTFPYFDLNATVKVCILFGGRSLFVLKETEGRSGRAVHNLISGDCFIEDGKGIEIAQKLGVEEESILIG